MFPLNESIKSRWIILIAMLAYSPDWIIAIGGGSTIDAAKAMWIKYEHPEITF